MQKNVPANINLSNSWANNVASPIYAAPENV